MSQRLAATHDTVGARSETSSKNEPVRSYAPDSPERQSIKAALAQVETETVDLPLFVSGRQVPSTRQLPVVMPHVLARHMRPRPNTCEQRSPPAAAPDWSRTSSTERASVFLKAADLLAGPWRDRLNAATMLGQSKTVHQAEIDSAAALIDFFRFNVCFMERIYREQPISVDGVWNRTDYRPLEGLVFAITPFNFTAIASNLPCAPALMGNTVLWKPAATAALSAHYVMEILQAAGLPPGVINLVHGDAPMIADIAFSEPDLAGVHFTGSTAVFDSILREVDARRYRNYPRIVGETGGKNFILAHASADLDGLAAAIIRGAFEYQGQKCSAASRLFIPALCWPALRSMLCDQIATVKYGDVTDFTNFMGAVIDERAWNMPSPPLPQGHVRVKVRAAGIGFQDALLIAGKYQSKPPFPACPGAEICGEVVEINAGVHALRVGDRVFALLHHGGYAEEVVLPETAAITLPPDVDDLDAAVLGMVSTPSSLPPRRRR